MDRVGTRRGLTVSVIWYSIVSMLTSLASGFYSFATFRFCWERANRRTGRPPRKAVSEWFPKRERALATALFDSGSSIGGAVAPFIVLWIYFRWGWRPAFVIPGLLGFLVADCWRWLYYPPEEHPRIGYGGTRDDRCRQARIERAAGRQGPPAWRDLLKLPQTWGTIIAKAFTDPVFFFVAEWFPIYLVAKGIELQERL